MQSLRQFIVFLKELLVNRHIIVELTKRDFKTKYLGSYLGMMWAFVHPAVYITILWFVFQVGFRSAPVENFPFILWLMAGIIPWFFFSDCLANATNSILDNSFLVKKVVFSIGMLPIVKILSSLAIHLFFLVVLFLMLAAYGYPPNLYMLQALYYLCASLFLLLGLSWITSSAVIFLRDIGQVVVMGIQFLFWLTPIFWSPKILPARYQFLVKLNPVYYITEGYREAFIHKVWFWEHAMLTIYFWVVTGVIFVVGAVVFRKLRPHFADVL